MPAFGRRAAAAAVVPPPGFIRRTPARAAQVAAWIRCPDQLPGTGGRVGCLALPGMRPVRLALVALAVAAAAVSGCASSAPRVTTDQRAEPALPEPRQEVAAAASDTLGLWVVAGFDTAGRSTASVFRYDGTRWSRERDLPVGLDHPAAAVLDGTVYVSGQLGRGRLVRQPEGPRCECGCVKRVGLSDAGRGLSCGLIHPWPRLVISVRWRCARAGQDRLGRRRTGRRGPRKRVRVHALRGCEDRHTAVPYPSDALPAKCLRLV
jgi:hypothetical protein